MTIANTARRSAHLGALALLLLVVYAALPALFGGNLYLMSVFIAALTIGGVALAWSLLGNLGGLVSFGHAAFFGVGSYASALLVMKAHWPVPLAMAAAGVCAALAAVLILPALRLTGAYFALAVLAYAHVFRIIATEWSSLTGGAAGIGSIPRLPSFLGFELGSKAGTYWTGLTLVLMFTLIYWRIRESDRGLALRAMQRSEQATRMVGVNSLWLKSLMLFLSAFMTGMMGAFNAHAIGFLEPDYAFSGLWTMLPIVAAIFGGYRSIGGPLVGAVVVYLLDQLLFKEIMPIGHQIVLGALLVLMILCSPDGLVPLLLRRTRHALGLRSAHA